MIDVVCGIVRNDAEEILVCRRAAHRHLGGLWEFPGGKVEAGESAEEALARELKEELGVLVRVGKIFKVTAEWTDGLVAIRLVGYWCVILEGVAEALEHKELRWCRMDELEGLAWAEADLPFVAEVIEGGRNI
ncbi:MAG: (deoxy)nucleoside triphosphate pyrophosphohydrolase [Armatimonadetes bacterium]|nr:(deoxy)nucleoside triphosphate pyrophosphohydrolase [Akkermansiaceae bacterium]